MTAQASLFLQRRHGEVGLGFELAPEAKARATDVSSSREAADAMNRSGRAATEAAVVLAALRRHPGATAWELTDASLAVGAELGQTRDEWHHTVSRRLPGLEDLDQVECVAPSYSAARPERRVNPNLSPCLSRSTPERTVRSIRWWPK